MLVIKIKWKLLNLDIIIKLQFIKMLKGLIYKNINKNLLNLFYTCSVLFIIKSYLVFIISMHIFYINSNFNQNLYLYT